MLVRSILFLQLRHIKSLIKKHGTNPVNGKKLIENNLIHLHFHKNEDGKFHCPATFKVFNDNSHIVAIRTTGQVYSWDAVNRLNIKPNIWKDLVTDESFIRSDIITLQDPHNFEARDMMQ